MPIVVSVENSTILRPPIDRAYVKAEGIEIVLSQRFPGQVPAGLVDRLRLIDVETLDAILRQA